MLLQVRMKDHSLLMDSISGTT